MKLKKSKMKPFNPKRTHYHEGKHLCFWLELNQSSDFHGKKYTIYHYGIYGNKAHVLGNADTIKEAEDKINRAYSFGPYKECFETPTLPLID
jgi:hypothetical protein